MSSLEQHLSVYSQALNLRSQRHQVLASNIANADTPHYKARDFDFGQAMQQALVGGAGETGLAMRVTSSRHFDGAGGLGAPFLQYRGETQSAVDGNTVDMDVERTQIAENALQYQIVSQLLSDKIKGLRTAMSSTAG